MDAIHMVLWLPCFSHSRLIRLDVTFYLLYSHPIRNANTALLVTMQCQYSCIWVVQNMNKPKTLLTSTTFILESFSGLIANNLCSSKSFVFDSIIFRMSSIHTFKLIRSGFWIFHTYSIPVSSNQHLTVFVKFNSYSFWNKQTIHTFSNRLSGRIFLSVVLGETHKFIRIVTSTKITVSYNFHVFL